MNESAARPLETGHGPTRNTLFSFVSQGIGAVFTTALTLFLVRWLGPTDYGVLALAVSMGTVILLISDFGISNAAARFAAEAPHDRMHVAGVLRTAFALKLIASTLLAIALVLLAPLIADAYDIPALTLPMQVMGIAVFVQGLGNLFLSLFQALGRISLNVGYALLESMVETSASILIVVLGGGVAGAVAGKAIGFGVAGILAGALAIRLVGWPALRDARGIGFSARRLAGYGALLVIINGVFAIFYKVDVLIIGAILGPAPAGFFEAATRILTFLQYLGIAVAAGFAPRLAAGRRTANDAALFVRAFRYSTLFYLFIAAPTLVWAEPIVGLMLGDAYSESASVLRALAPTVVLFGVGEVLAVGVNYLGEAKRRVPLAISALIINTVIDLILVPEIGITAGAIGTGVAFAVYVGGHLRICEQTMEVSFVHLIPTVGRGLLASGVAGLALFAFGTSDLSPLDCIAGSLLAIVGFTGVLLLLRELRPEELRSGFRLARQQLRRGT